MFALRPYQSDIIAQARDLIRAGDRVGFLTAVEPCGSRDGVLWRCVCECGVEVIRQASQLNKKLRANGFASCGCRKRRPVVSDGMRSCTRCGELKPISDYVKNSSSADNIGNWCYVCRKEWRERNSAMLRESKASHYRKNLEQNRAKSRERATMNKEAANLRSKKWREANRDKRKEVANNWVRRNKDYACAQAGKRRSAKLNATPAWANEFFIREVYRLARTRAKLTRVNWHVDHVVPLRSKIVCGLHCEHNLAVIPADQNHRKSNRYWPDMP